MPGFGPQMFGSLTAQFEIKHEEVKNMVARFGESKRVMKRRTQNQSYSEEFYLSHHPKGLSLKMLLRMSIMAQILAISFVTCFHVH